MGRRARARHDRYAGEMPASRLPDAAAKPLSLTDSGTAADPRALALAGAVLLVLIAVVYAQVRGHQLLNYDDPIYLTNNEHVKAGLTLAGVRWAFTSLDFNWHPVTWLSHMLDVQLFGVTAGPLLLINVAFHAVNSLLLLLFLDRATARLWPSAFVAAAFAVHPTHVESVAWLAERKDVLSTFFFLLSLLLYLRFVRNRSKGTYALLAATFMLGLMAKQMVVTLPFVLLLLDYWPLARLKNFSARAVWPLVREKLILFAIMIPGAAVALVGQHATRAIADPNKAPLLARLANAAIAYVVYLGKLLWPANLALPYPYRVVIAPSKAILSVIALVAITVAVVALRKRAPYILTGWLWFLGTLVPVIGLIQIGFQGTADRYMYIPSIGFLMAVVWLIADYVAAQPQLRVAAAVAGCAAVLILTVAARVQVSYWKDPVTLFSHSVAVTTHNIYARLTLGEALLDRKEPAAAVRQFEIANAIFPGLALAHHNLGQAYVALGRLDDAVREYQAALRIDPNEQQVYQELAAVEARRGHDEEAKRALIGASALAGDAAAVAAVQLARGDTRDAIARYTNILESRPGSAAAHNDLAAALARAGRDDEALQHYQKALAIDPRLYDAQMNVSALLSRHDRNDEALTHLDAAAQLRPKSTEPHIYRALLLAQLGRKQEAAQEARTAMTMDANAANTQFTEAVRIPPNPANLQQFIAALEH